MGDGALAGKAGIQDHLDDLDRLFQDDQKMAKIKQEMAGVFRQKCELGLMDVGKWHDAQGDDDFFSDEEPLVLLILVDHDPAKSKLASELSAATDMQKGELSISRASNMGYALYQECLLSKQDWLDFDEKTREKKEERQKQQKNKGLAEHLSGKPRDRQPARARPDWLRLPRGRTRSLPYPPPQKQKRRESLRPWLFHPYPSPPSSRT